MEGKDDIATFQSVANHRLLHVVKSISDNCGVPSMTDDTEEEGGEGHRTQCNSTEDDGSEGTGATARSGTRRYLADAYIPVSFSTLIKPNCVKIQTQLWLLQP